MADPKGIGDLSRHDLRVITQIEETDPNILAHPYLLRFPPAISEENTPMANAIQEQLPVKIFRYGGDDDPDINMTVMSLFESERDRRLESNENIVKGPFLLQDSLTGGFGTKTFEPKKGASKEIPKLKVNKPDIFLVEGFGEDLHEYLKFFHNLIIWYKNENCPSMFVLTAEGYKSFFGFQGYAGSGWVDVYTNELPLPNGVTPRSECYRVSRLGIVKQ